MARFKDRYTFEDRLIETARIREKFPGRIPVIVERASRSTNIPMIDKEKFLVPGDLTISQFIYVIRRRLSLNPETALFLFIGGTLPTTSSVMRELYYVHKDPDGFIYVTYSGENTFGIISCCNSSVLP